ncbi:hypothetical protein [Campylobacter vulpis]|uniref:hypothetical protein n=1 Tax=Campylobacter vulpis TaxID=1655500 RepID=UPI000C14B0D0|nr:hypothetical protein [Campylobacter vulpis]MBS4275608.1 hypothetical protein [Campylobacter vulpis]MBS4306809.1 hypothetical protein [Campylobacter vulpis]MBS4329917.1 hypothetical protein [Campylobacter vulpis]MBS4423564.1 hypothetical protein [Campylobacter vulpis]PHY89908.1 hypothetical protein AA995_07150 [Campylobacter vulpis]
MKKMYELERAKVRILRETKGAFSDENLAECADFVENTFNVYLTKAERKQTRKEGLFHLIVCLMYRKLRRFESIGFRFSNNFIELINKDEVKENSTALGVDIENLKLRGDFERILYVLLQEKQLLARRINERD